MLARAANVIIMKMPRWSMLPAALLVSSVLVVLMVSGCTTNITDKTIDINNVQFDTFTSSISSSDCNAELDANQRGEYDCTITSVDLSSKTFDCACVKKGLI